MPYTPYQRYIATVLLFALPFQSCQSQLNVDNEESTSQASPKSGVYQRGSRGALTIPITPTRLASQRATSHPPFSTAICPQGGTSAHAASMVRSVDVTSASVTSIKAPDTPKQVPAPIFTTPRRASRASLRTFLLGFLLASNRVFGQPVAMFLDNVGETYEELGEKKKDLEYYEQALTMLRTLYRDQPHPEVAAFLNNVGWAYDALGDTKKGLTYYEQALEMLKALYGDCLLYTSPSPRDGLLSRMPSSA